MDTIAAEPTAWKYSNLDGVCVCTVDGSSVFTVAARSNSKLLLLVLAP
jgi:hypothetical protein